MNFRGMKSAEDHGNNKGKLRVSRLNDSDNTGVEGTKSRD